MFFFFKLSWSLYTTSLFIVLQLTVVCVRVYVARSGLYFRFV